MRNCTRAFWYLLSAAASEDRLALGFAIDSGTLTPGDDLSAAPIVRSLLADLRVVRMLLMFGPDAAVRYAFDRPALAILQVPIAWSSIAAMSIRFPLVGSDPFSRLTPSRHGVYRKVRTLHK